MYFWAQFIDASHPAGMTPGKGGSVLHHLHTGNVESGPVGDVFVGLHMADNGVILGLIFRHT